MGSPSAEASKKINILTFPPLIENGYVSSSVKEIVVKIDRSMFEQREKMLSEAFNKLKEGEGSEG